MSLQVKIEIFEMLKSPGKTDSLAVLTSLLEAVPLGEGLDQTVAR